jgi:L,D-peptidoglycan transpeptidase YkuD (ErfK/YbiS/YcfS/YnhG family)
MSCAIGRGGIGVKIGEGDGITPAGEYRLTQIWNRHDRIGVNGAMIGLFDHWCDDTTSALYNRPFRALWPAVSAERMHRSDPLYDLVGVLDFNIDAVPGAGSAIFLHVWRKPRHPTEGCIAFDRRDLVWILERWSPRSRVIIQA